MLSHYNPHSASQRALSNAPRSSLQGNIVSTFFQDDFFSDFHKEFENMSNKMMSRFDKHFGDFGAPFSSMLSRFDEDFASMGNFSDLHQNMARMGGGTGTVVQRSYVSSTVLDKNGKKHQEKYFSNNVAHRGNDGNTISERQEGYRNSQKGIDRIGQERMLNDKGRKVVKERNKALNEEAAHNYYYNIDENQRDDFDREWMDHNSKVNFIDKNKKLLGHFGNDQYRLPQRERENEEPRNYQQQRSYQDDQRRGEYVPVYKKLPSMPVRVNPNPYNYNGDNYYPRVRASDLQPAPIALGNAPYQQPPINTGVYQPQINNNVPPVAVQRGLPVGNAVPVRNRGDQAAGVFRNKGVVRNSIPKAG